MTSTTVTPGRPLPGWLKTGLLAALVFVLCWGGAIAWWRMGGSEPGTWELVLLLLALPLTILASTWGLRTFVKRPLPSKVEKADPAPQPAPDTAPAPPLAILASALRSPHGASADELAAAIADNKARPDLDPELVDNKGFPITAARRDDAADEEFKAELSDWLTGVNMAELRFSEAQWRALTLGTAVVRDLASEAASTLIPSEGIAPALRLIPILPAEWSSEHRHAAGMWFKHQAAQFGWPSTALTCVEVPVAAGSVPAAIKRFVRDTEAVDQRFAALLLGCESHIDQESVDRWQAAGALFTSSTAQEVIPGEGAAGILLTSLQFAQSIGHAPYVVLDPFFDGRHEVSIDASKRPDTRLLAGFAERSCKQASVELAEVAMVVSDTGERPNRMLELMGMVATSFPHLDDQADVARIGASSGACGSVPCITALALARHHAIARAAPVLYVGNEDPHQRCTALLRPAAPV